MDILKARKKALEDKKGEVKEPTKAPVVERVVEPPKAEAAPEKKPAKSAKKKPQKKAAPAPEVIDEEEFASAPAIKEEAKPAPEKEPVKIRDISAIPNGARSPEEIVLLPHEIHDLPGTQEMPELPEASDDELRGAVELGSMIDAPTIEEAPPVVHKAKPVEIETFDEPEPVVERHYSRGKKKEEEPPKQAETKTEAPVEKIAEEKRELSAHETADEEERQKEILSADEIPLEFLSFLIGREEYGIPLYKISETIKPREITEVPRVPKFVLGVLTLRGVVIPIFDLAHKLSLGSVEKSKFTRIIIVNREEEKIGLMVDRVKDVVRVLPRDIEPPPQVVAGVDRQFLQGIGRAESLKSERKLEDGENEEREEVKDMKNVKRRLVILLDLERVATL